MNLVHTLIYGIVEGITEFLPISSTGHLILTAHLLHAQETEFLKSFEIAIQLGAILSVVVLYWRAFLVKPEVLKRVFAAFVPTAIIGFALYKFIKRYLLASESVVLWSLFIGGIILIVFEMFHREEKATLDDLASLPYGTAALIGVFQALAVIPGVSRSGATIVGGMSLGVKRKTIVEFSFLLAVPTMLAATVLDLYKSASAFSMADMHVILLGAFVSFVVAMLAIRFFLSFIQRHTFIPFGVYRILAALAFWFVIR